MGSHVQMATGFWDSATMKQVYPTPVLSPVSEAGDVILFDLRLKHFGGANPSKVDRPLLYISYVREWFRDGVNFKGWNSGAWARLPTKRLKKLLKRVDERAFTTARVSSTS